MDPLRWKPFQPTHSDYLSPVAVQVLSHQQGCIKFIGVLSSSRRYSSFLILPTEPTVSHQTLLQRQTRQIVLGVACLLQMICRRGIDMVSQCLEDDTPLPALYRRLREKAPHIPKLTWDDLLNILILSLWFSLAVASWGGYITLEPRERARKWVHTGSFSL